MDNEQRRKPQARGARETGFADDVKQLRWRKWLAENREAISDYNRHIARHGLFSDCWRTF